MVRPTPVTGPKVTICSSNKAYDSLDLTALPDDYLPRTKGSLNNNYPFWNADPPFRHGLPEPVPWTANPLPR